MHRRLTAIVEREGDGYVAHCPEMDVASQGNSVAEARTKLEEALTLFFETASEEEVERRTQSECYVTHVEVAVGWAAGSLGSGGVPHSHDPWLYRGEKARQPCRDAEGTGWSNDHGAGAGPSGAPHWHTVVDHPAIGVEAHRP